VMIEAGALRTVEQWLENREIYGPSSRVEDKSIST